jgi:hypothetical protein
MADVMVCAVRSGEAACGWCVVCTCIEPLPHSHQADTAGAADGEKHERESRRALGRQMDVGVMAREPVHTAMRDVVERRRGWWSCLHGKWRRVHGGGGRWAIQKQDGKQTNPRRAVGVGVEARSGGAGTAKARIRRVLCVYNKRRCFLIRRRCVSGQMSRPISAPDAQYMAEIPNTQATKRGPAVSLVFTRPADAIGRAASTRRPPGTLPAPLDGDRRSRLCARRWVVRPR